jgi:hypothetical protein
MPEIKERTTDLVRLPTRPLSDLLFSGGNFELEKRWVPLTLSVNYAILGLVILFNAPFSIELICWTAVIFSLSAGIVTRLRGRWLALMIFSVPILLKIVQTGMGTMDWLVLWIVCLISLSAAYSSFNIISGFAKWLKGRQKIDS